MSSPRDRRSLAAQAGGDVDPTHRDLVAPIHPSTTYERGVDGGYPGGASYTRDENPGYQPVERLLSLLEGGEESLVFASGMAAAAAVIDSLRAGARVIAPEVMYWALRSWMTERAEAGAFSLVLVENGDLDSMARALAGGADLLWLETPANPTMEIVDLREAARLGHGAGATVVADSTVATPVHTRPLEFGVDIVHHSATKSLNGHSDVLGGSLTTNAASTDLWKRIRTQRSRRGGVMGPFEAWLLLRGMRTLFVRVEAASAGAQRVAEFLDRHAGVSQVFYPGLASHPGHEVARKQMEGGFGSLLSFRVAAGESAARKVANSTRLIKQATSLGGTESLIEHRASVESAGSPVPRDLLRLSVGIEAPEDLMEDLESALAAAADS